MPTAKKELQKECIRLREAERLKVPEETEEQRTKRLTDAYMQRTRRKTFTSAGVGNGPRLVDTQD